MRNILIDAGPLIAIFAVDDKHHGHYDQLISEISATGLRVVTTWPCIVEASYLLGIPQRFELLQWIELGGVVVYPFSPHHLGDMVAWMRGPIPQTTSARWIWPMRRSIGSPTKQGYGRS